MEISATIKNTFAHNETSVQTNGDAKEIRIPAKGSGYGSSVNGGELLLLALATCFCNDIYREAASRNINVSEVNVIVTGDFGAAGEPGTNFRYKASIVSDAPATEIDELITYTDQVAEVHNTLRRGTPVTLVK